MGAKIQAFDIFQTPLSSHYPLPLNLNRGLIKMGNARKICARKKGPFCQQKKDRNFEKKLVKVSFSISLYIISKSFQNSFKVATPNFFLADKCSARSSEIVFQDLCATLEETGWCEKTYK
jgi:hypothetical protein